MLDKLLYCRAFRETIHALKSKGNLRTEVLQKLAWRMALTHLVFLSGLLLVTFYFWGQWDHLIVFGGTLSLFEVAMLAVGHGQGNVIISTGEIAEGTLRYANYEGGGRGWNLGYEFTDSCGVPHRCRSKPTKCQLGRADPKRGDSVLVFYDASNPKRNRLFIPYTFGKTCISKSRYERLCNEPLAMR